MNKVHLSLFFFLGLVLLACNNVTFIPNSGDKTPPEIRFDSEAMDAQSDSTTGTIKLIAIATDNIRIKKVDFYLGLKLLKSDTTTPYEAEDTQLVSGVYTYRAIATDTVGLSTTATVPVTLTRPTPVSSVSGMLLEADPTSASLVVTQAWASGAGTITGKLGSDGTTVISPATVNTAGLFTLNLPTTVADTQLVAFNAVAFAPLACSGQPTFSNTNTFGTWASFSVSAGKSGTIQPLTTEIIKANDAIQSWFFSQGGLWYVNRPVKVSGITNCVKNSKTIPTTFNLNLVTGWNKITMQNTVNKDLSESSIISSGKFPIEQWIVFNPPLFKNPF